MPKTTFGKRYGHYVFVVMSFGLPITPVVFIHMDQGLQGKFSRLEGQVSVSANT